MAIVSPRVKTLSGKQCSVSGNCQHSCVKGHSLSLKTKPQQYTCVSSVPLLRISPAKVCLQAVMYILGICNTVEPLL